MRFLKRLAGGIAAGFAFAIVLWTVAHGTTLLRWFVYGAKYGDWLNDWLTYLPEFAQAVLLWIVRGGG